MLIARLYWLYSTLIAPAKRDKKRAQVLFSIEPYKSRFDRLNSTPISHSDIVMVGDSLTQGGAWQSRLSMPIKNFGIAGDIIEALNERIDYVLERAPKKLFIMIGVNNILGTKDGSDEFFRKYRGLLRKIKAKAPHTEVYIQSLLPVSLEYGLPLTLVQYYNWKLQELCLHFGMEYIALHGAFMEPVTRALRAEFTTDGLHLNEDGYKIWANLIRDRVQLP